MFKCYIIGTLRNIFSKLVNITMTRYETCKSKECRVIDSCPLNSRVKAPERKKESERVKRSSCSTCQQIVIYSRQARKDRRLRLVLVFDSVRRFSKGRQEGLEARRILLPRIEITSFSISPFFYSLSLSFFQWPSFETEN